MKQHLKFTPKFTSRVDVNDVLNTIISDNTVKEMENQNNPKLNIIKDHVKEKIYAKFTIRLVSKFSNVRKAKGCHFKIVTQI